MEDETTDLETELKEWGFAKKLRLEDPKFIFLMQMDILRQTAPKEYEAAKRKKVTIRFRTTSGHGSNYGIECAVEGVVPATPAYWQIDGTPEELDSALRDDAKRLRREGFNNIDYQGRVC
ncbi:hypothetical protein KY349_01440 [Candidatus Woesearchaeota archaeon]|nr:hypothetical protein [Candidatus Woesearchaeota archaeon]